MTIRATLKKSVFLTFTQVPRSREAFGGCLASARLPSAASSSRMRAAATNIPKLWLRVILSIFFLLSEHSLDVAGRESKTRLRPRHRSGEYVKSMLLNCYRLERNYSESWWLPLERCPRSLE